MHRRRLLALALPLLGGCSSLPKASGPRTPPTPGEPDSSADRSLGVRNLDVEEAEDGHLRVLATVVNRSNTDRTRTLRIRVRAGETRTERQQTVSVAAGESQEVAFDFTDVAYDDFSGDGSLNTAWL
ncbi:transcriptional initiation protein Tat [Haloplanus sp. C73]|uniref:transcriptional initiation protein Tat n=1 Tax=Haloplanus sp. C73 TaxID=3421641 RepID=UPI003EBB4FD8